MLKNRNVYFLSLFSLFQNLPFVNSLWVPTQGWYLEWAKYAKSGIIYRDFYQPFGPTYTFLNMIWSIFPDPLLAQRLGDLLVWTFLLIGIYIFLLNFLPSRFSFFSALISSTIFQFSATNTIGGYYELSLCFIVWAGIALQKKSNLFSFFGGCFLSLGVLTKQNWLPIFVVFTIFSLVSWRSVANQIVKRVMLFTIGALSVFAILALYLFLNGALTDFLLAMLSAGGKSPNVERLLQNLILPITQSNSLILVFLLSICFMPQNKMVPNFRGYYWQYILFAIVLTKYFLPLRFQGLLWGRSDLVLIIIISFLLLIRVRDFGRSNYAAYLIVASSLIPGFFIIFTDLVLRLRPNTNVALELNATATHIATQFTNIALPLSILGFVLFFRRKKLFHTGLDENQERLQSLFLITLFLSGVLNSFNGGFDFNSNLILGSLGIGFILKKISKSVEFYRPLICVALLFVFASVSIAGNVYSWFGWDEKVGIHTNKKVNDTDLFRNFILTQEEHNFYSQLSTLITSARQEIDPKFTDNPTLMTFPMQPIVNRLQPVSPYVLRCPVLHFDICNDFEAKKDYKNIQVNPPDIVVVFDLGDPFIEENENAWRYGKKSVYRSIQDFLLSERYVKIGEVLGVKSNLAKVSVLVSVRAHLTKS
jgi:hypothetical protein